MERGGVRHQGPEAGAEHPPETGPVRNRPHERHQSVVREHDGCPRVVEFVRELVRLEHRIDRHVDRARLEDPEEGHRELRAVAEKHCHGIARTDVVRLEQGGEPIAQPVHLGEGHDPPVVVVERRVRRLPGPMTEMVGQRDLAQWVVGLPRHAGRPVGVLDRPEALQVLGFGQGGVLIHGSSRPGAPGLSR